jgi:branched-chain amino acid aminotransferase
MTTPGTPTADRRWIFHQGEFVPAGQARLGPRTQALHYGTGVFEGIRSYWQPDSGLSFLVRASEHYARLLSSAQLMRLRLPYGADELIGITKELIRRNDLRQDAYIRPVAYKLALEPGIPFGVRLSGVSSELTILALPMGANAPQDGIRCGITSWRRTPDTSLPARAKITGGYANNALGVDEVTSAGYDDAIFLNQRGDVAEAGTANIFIVLDGEVTTPSADSDILAGITRSAAIEILRAELDRPVAERVVLRSELLAADEVFLTGTGAQITPVIEIDGRPIGSGEVGPVTKRIRTIYERAVRGGHTRYRHWLTPVEFDPT